MNDESRTKINLALDHVIHAVRNPEDTRHAFERDFGIHTVPGGVHSAWGTWNTLAYFGLTYIEWMGIKDNELAAHSFFGQSVLNRLKTGEGVGQFALRTMHMDEWVNLWRQRGLAFVGPIDGQRDRPDGTTIRWRMLFLGQPGGNDATRSQAILPFVIEWAEDDEVRTTDLEAIGAILPHDTARIVAAHLATENPGEWVRQFQAYFRSDGPQGHDSHDAPSVGRSRVELDGIDLYLWTRTDALEHFEDLQLDAVPGLFQLDVYHKDSEVDSESMIHVIAGLRIKMSDNRRR